MVNLLFFPGGDIGKLAVNGTVNDLAMASANPQYLSAGFILEEGFAIADLRRLKDPTRGGIATSLNEIAFSSEVGIALAEQLVPIDPAVCGACEILGLDRLTIANEGKLLAIGAADQAESALKTMLSHPLGQLCSKSHPMTPLPVRLQLLCLYFVSGKNKFFQASRGVSRAGSTKRDGLAGVAEGE